MRYVIAYHKPESPKLITFTAVLADNEQDAARQFAENHPDAIIRQFKPVEDVHEAYNHYGMGAWTDEERAQHREKLVKNLEKWNDEHAQARRRVEAYSLDEFSAEQEYKARRERETSSNAEGVHVGDIFVACWGYDQTNYDFYQVVEIKGKHTAVVQENECVEQMCSDYNGYKRPIRDHFKNETRYTVRTSWSEYSKCPQMRVPDLSGRHYMEPAKFGELYSHSCGA